MEPFSSTAVATVGFFPIEIGASRIHTWNNQLHLFLQLRHRLATGRENQLAQKTLASVDRACQAHQTQALHIFFVPFSTSLPVPLQVP